MPIRLIQLSDTHLFADPGGQLLGITTRRSFEAVLDQVMALAPDALILTGDLVHDESAVAYRYLNEALAKIGLPCACIPGNHDLPELMMAHLAYAPSGPVALRRLGGWNLILLDSRIQGEDGGHLHAEQFAQLDALLSAEDAPALIALHHHPVAVGSPWLDGIGVADGATLLALCERRPQIKAILFGHIHQAFAAQHGDCLLLGTPSTCLQFKPASAEFALDAARPGWRELSLYPDGHLETRVMFLDDYAEQPLRKAEGY
ncbi:3',5'-cyclic-AMP phosphodiesterase [Caldichromatium japonicum]|uniref:3',5'-cyclic-AMP phosphodiesterase n=2 Tax=Caldichromatium japonicum TaxID=2699430 RepID=A0A6G7VGB0_9GAMM|nr:3',5'-cyclic-AMP phosphodiesterase [Caldichromatium japonicum]